MKTDYTQPLANLLALVTQLPHAIALDTSPRPSTLAGRAAGSGAHLHDLLSILDSTSDWDTLCTAVTEGDTKKIASRSDALDARYTTLLATPHDDWAEPFLTGFVDAFRQIKALAT